MIKLLSHEIRILRMPYAIPTPALSKLDAIPIKKIENKPAVLIVQSPLFSLFVAYYENVEQLCLSVSYTCNKCSTFFQR